MDSSDRLSTGVLVGDDFVIERELARGGMGTVYLAKQRSTGRVRALKILHASLLEQGKHTERFLQEARIGAAFHSPHVVEVIAAGVHRELGTPWLAMELLEGQTLAQRVEQQGPLAWPEITQLAAQLGDALGAAHAAGVVHRDIKPENLFLCATSTASFHWSLKVLDFGIAKVVQESRTSATATASIGTPLWMAPEQTDSHGRISPQTDVWSLALVVFWAHVRRPFWRAANVEPVNLSAILRELILDPIEPASVRAHALGAMIPTALDPWFARCLQRDPLARFANGRDACNALVAALSALHEAPVSTAVAFAPTTAMPAAIPQSDPAPVHLRPISAPAPPQPSPTVAAQPPPVEQPAQSAKSSAATRALWAVAALCTLVGLVGIGVGINNRFEFVGFDHRDRPRRNTPTVRSNVTASNALTGPLTPTYSTTATPTTQPTVQPAQQTQPTVIVPTQTVIPTIVERARTHDAESDNDCQQLSNGALNTAYTVEQPPPTEAADDQDARRHTCRSAYALCHAHGAIPCPQYPMAQDEGHSVWCCP